MPHAIRIGIAARQTGLSVDAIRFYERQGLMGPASRSAAGYRLFQQRDVEDLLFVRGAQEIGFSIREIRELMSLRGGAQEPCQQVAELIATKLDSARKKIALLKTLEVQLQQALNQCRRALDVERRRGEPKCPVLEQIARGSGTRGGG